MIAAASMPTQTTSTGQFSTLIKGLSNMGEDPFHVSGEFDGSLRSFSRNAKGVREGRARLWRCG
jgi:hypothetical protein